MIKQGVFLTGSGMAYTGDSVRRRRKKRRRAPGRAGKELVLTVLAAAVLLCLFLLMRCGSRPAESLEPEGAAEQAEAVSVPELRQIPVQAEGVIAGSGLLGGHYTYYAGPTESIIKEPGEIRIALDPGHGGTDDGCVRRGVLEKDLNLSIAEGVKERLEAMGYQVLLTRDSDCACSLKERVKTAKAAHADIYVSIHQNSSEISRVNGMELYYSVQNAGADSRRLAELIQNHAVQDTGAYARAIFEWEELYVIRESAMPSCLIETGFLTNASERNRLKSPEYREKIADGIASGIDRYFRPEADAS